MSVGKYSPVCPYALESGWERYKFNAYGEPPVAWNKTVFESGVVYDEKLMYGNYDEEGFDSYGYSAFDSAGNYVGPINGVDRCGNTEMEYLYDSIDGGDLYETASPIDFTLMKKERKK